MFIDCSAGDRIKKLHSAHKGIFGEPSGKHEIVGKNQLVVIGTVCLYYHVIIIDFIYCCKPGIQTALLIYPKNSHQPDR